MRLKYKSTESSFHCRMLPLTLEHLLCLIIISLYVDTMQRAPFGGHIIFNYLIGDRNYVLKPEGLQLYIKLEDNEVTLP